MALTMSASVEIARPAGPVFDYIANMELNPTWQRGMRECRFTSEPSLRTGSTYDQVASFLGCPIESSFVVTALEPGRSITIETVESLGDARCRASETIEGGPGGLMRLFMPLMKLIAQRFVRGDYARLRALIEAEGGQ